MTRWFAILLLCLLGMAPAPSPYHTETHAFFVSTTGSDTNPGTYSQPFATLGKCQTAMEGSSKKTCYIRGGTYSVSALPKVALAGGPTTAVVALTGSDNGTTWSYYPPDGVDSAVFDGGNNVNGGTGYCQDTNYIDWGFYVGGASNITINGLTFQHFTFGGVLVHGGSDSWGNWVPTGGQGEGTSNQDVIENNIVQNINNGQNVNNACSTTAPYTGWPNTANTLNTMGSILVQGKVTNLTITHNVVQNTMGMGIDFETFNSGDTVAGLNINHNYMTSLDTQCNDCGAIHFFLAIATNTSAPATGALIQYNYLHDCGGNSATRPTNGRCIYLDDTASGFTVSNNVMAGLYAVAGNIHGGPNNTYQYNIVDLGNGSEGNENIMTYQNSGDCTSGASCMTGNYWENNIIIDNSSVSSNGSYNNFTPDSPLNGQNDLDHEYGTGSISDTFSASTSNPSFQTGWTYTLASNSPAYSSPISFPVQPAAWGSAGFWGPPGFTIPQTGTAPSYPH